MISVTHNMLAMNANRQYGIVLGGRQKSTEKLSSGYKINRAADDAAGLQISEKMRSQVRGLNQGSDNVQDGISLVQIADGALAEVNDMLHRMTELSVKSANGTNTTADRQAIQHEITQIISEIDRIHQSTEFNTMKLFDGEQSLLSGFRTGGLVESKSAEKGEMLDIIQNGSKYYRASVLDFSNINKSNISKLYDKSFSFTCTQNCNEEFMFTLKNGGGNDMVNVPNGGGDYKHKYSIDISGCNDGADIVKAIYDYVKTKASISSPQFTDALRVSHSNEMMVDGKKLIVYGTESFASEAKAAAKTYNPGMGKVVCNELTGQVEVGKMKPFWIQASGVPGDGLEITVEKMNAEYIGIKDIDVSTLQGARDAIDKIVDAGAMISSNRSRLGAFQNRMEHTYANNENKAENTQAAESRIRDTDMATEMVQFTKSNILAQVGESMMAQANQSNQGVLSLLGG